MNVAEIRSKFRSPRAADYPELTGYTRAEIYEGKMGPGGLYLAARMSRCLHLRGGQRVLDLGCGRGTTSAFLAKRFDVAVVAVDLWIPATQLYERFRRDRIDDRVVPLNLDVTAALPFAHDYFDAIFCMDSIHYYGGNPAFWAHLLPHLKPGGRLCLGSPCFSGEFPSGAVLPPEYDDGTDLWPVEFSRYHSPGWWADLIRRTGAMQSVESSAIEDGIILWEDDVLQSLECGGTIETAATDAAQITFRRADLPYLTHFVLAAQKKC
jgi:SAM-dependent methyltransferase